MCGRFVAATPPQMLAKAFGVDAVQLVDREADYNVAPRRTIAVVCETAEDPGGLVRVLRGMRWGLVPSWAKDPSIGDRMINARGETVATKPAFRRAFAKRRCIVPADAFYEWKTQLGQKRKQPMVIRRRDGHPLAFAGLFERWRDPDGPPDQEPLATVTIITGSANELIAPIHDRMPVVLPDTVWDRWLDPDFDDVAALEQLLVPAPSEWFEAYPVSTRVNAVRDHDAGLIEPLAESGQPPLLD